MFIIRASNLIAIHNLALGNTTRYRLVEYTKNSIKYFIRLVLEVYMERDWATHGIVWLFSLKSGCLKT